MISLSNSSDHEAGVRDSEKKDHETITERAHGEVPGFLLLTRVSHAAPDSRQVFTLPLLHLLLHLVDLGRVQSPQAALPGRAAHLVLHFLEAFVQRQVVPHGVLPAVGCRLSVPENTNRKERSEALFCLEFIFVYSSVKPHLKVGEVFLHEAVDLTDREAACLTVLQSHSDQAAGEREMEERT